MSPNVGGEKGPNAEINQAAGVEFNNGRPAEAVPSRQEASPAKQPLVQIPVLPQTSVHDDTTATASKTDSTTPKTDDSGLIATNSDRIEKQWVERTKTVITQTQDDPRRQKDEISKIKAEYIKKRFKKIIRVK